MATRNVVLSDGQPSEWRILDLYELDAVPFGDPGEYAVTYENGQKQTYTLAHWPDGEPETPPVPKDACEVGGLHWAMWNRWELYQRVLAHRLSQIEAGERYAHDIAHYILEHCPIDPADRARVAWPEDLAAVIEAVMVREVGQREVEAALAATFQGVI